ncbi:class I SAM-dependent methyltransferase [Liberiplasma polymorphum]|uniref:class I SAM-dependent methyltransferase n=1 Tax=Liberiplasma polymorphum TaxID=3374570 RepID=UPI0037752AD1
MSKTSDIEIFYDYIDAIAMKLYAVDKSLYLEGIKEALNFLLDNTTTKELSDDIIAYFQEEKAKIVEISFSNENIRKAIQLALLKGFKHARITNAQMTPDTIGIFLSYLVKKLYKSQTINLIFDPLIGTSNLVATLYNHYESPFEVHGIDDDPLMCDLARNILDSLHIDHQVFLQDTLTYLAGKYDLIVTDFPPHKKDDKDIYLPYHTIIHHLEHLKEEHYLIAIIENDFFEQKQQALFKELLDKKAHLYGLIKLDEGLFKTHPKSILILKKKTKESEKLNDFLIVDLPSFSDLEAFNKAINKMDQWFKKKEVDVQ